MATAPLTGSRAPRLAALAASALGTQGVLAAISAFVPPLLASAHGARPGLIGAALAIGPLLGLVVPSAVGALIDRAHGDARPRRAVMSGGAAAAVLGLAALTQAGSSMAALIALALVFAGLHAVASAQRASVAHEVEPADHAAATAAQAAAKGVGALVVLTVGSALVARAPAAGLWLAGALLAGSTLISATSLRAHATRPRPTARPLLASPAVRRLLLGHAALWVSLHAMFAFTGLYVARELLGATDLDGAAGRAATAQATQVLAVFALTALVAALPVGSLARRFGGRRALAGGLVALALGLALAVVARDARWAWPIAALCGVGFAAVQVVPYPLLLAQVGRGREGALAAAFTASIEAPQLVALVVAGALVEATGSYRAVYAFSLAALVIGALAWGLHRADHRGDAHEAQP